MDRKRILVVEDEALIAMDLKSDLVTHGYEVPAVVPSGEEAIRMAAELHPDLVLMDISLSGTKNGIEAAYEILRSNAMPIVFLTAHANSDTIGKAKITEPFGYLTKPYTIDALMSTIEVALYKAEADALRRNAERAVKKIEEELVKARNLEALGILAGGIAHDFNNLFQGLLGSISMAKYNTPRTSKAFHYLEQAESAYHAVSSLTNQLIAFSNGGIMLRETIQPSGLIREAVSSATSGPDIKTVFNLADDLLSISADAGQLAQVISNITLNAQEAMPSGGNLLVTAANTVLQPLEVAGLEPGRYVKISIEDKGCGISTDVLPKIFDPYFSTKDRGSQKGMGLGLAVSNAIIKKHNGMITVDSEPGKGSTFTIYLPAQQYEKKLS